MYGLGLGLALRLALTLTQNHVLEVWQWLTNCRRTFSGSDELLLLTASAGTACVTAGTSGVVDGATGLVVGVKGSSTSCEPWTVAGSSTLVPEQCRFRCASASTLAASVVTSAPVSGCRDECTTGAVGTTAASSGEATAASLTPTANEKGDADMPAELQAVTQGGKLAAVLFCSCLFA